MKQAMNSMVLMLQLQAYEKKPGMVSALTLIFGRGIATLV